MHNYEIIVQQMKESLYTRLSSYNKDEGVISSSGKNTLTSQIQFKQISDLIDYYYYLPALADVQEWIDDEIKNQHSREKSKSKRGI